MVHFWPLAMAIAMAMATALVVAVIRPEHALGADLHENQLFLKNMFVDLFWSFLDLLDLKNGSGSKFYAGKWYREVWKPKFKQFYEKSVKCYKRAHL